MTLSDQKPDQVKKIFIAGASGFVGSILADRFLESGHRVTGIGTSKEHPVLAGRDRFNWISADTTREGDWQAAASSSDLIINLAGRTIFRYWTPGYKQAIYDSRILTTKNIINSFERGKNQTLLTTSAVGIYGDAGDQVLFEGEPPGGGFLARVCRDWEAEAARAAEKEVRVCVMRFGVVLGKGGALSKMLPAFKMFLGGPLGSGQQWFPWIHISDIFGGILFLSAHPELEGPFNFTAPAPVRQIEFARALGSVLGRPSFFPAPGFAVRTVMGEMGGAFLESQRAEPGRLVEAGYRFHFSRVSDALADLAGR